jgi:hypothetical protein
MLTQAGSQTCQTIMRMRRRGVKAEDCNFLVSESAQVGSSKCTRFMIQRQCKRTFLRAVV